MATEKIHQKGVTMNCPECDKPPLPPVVKGGDLFCKSCEYPLDWVNANIYKNQQNDDRVARERARSNKGVVRSHRLKK
jgi:uncharacterized Zn finger protein (UPF0148 family)